MEFCIEKKVWSKKRELKKEREEMIKKESLHIHDFINYNQFLELYTKYGNELAEDEFADIFLDISKTNYYKLKKGKAKILKKEMVEDIEIEILKLKAIKELGLKKEQNRSHNELLEIYNSVPNKLSFIMFAEKVLDVAQGTVSDIKTNGYNAIIFRKTNSDYFDVSKCDNALKNIVQEKENKKIEISELKDTIAQDRNLHVNDSINKKDFKELYQIYGKGFSEVQFAENILGISNCQTQLLLNDKIEKAIIWKDEIISLDYLLKIREDTIRKEKLHINEEIDYQRFKEIYQKHSGILSEVDFALEILGIQRTRYNELKKGKSKSLILSDIEVPKNFYPIQKDNLKQNEHVYRAKMITYNEFLKLYEKYGFVTNYIDFAKEVLEIEHNEYRDLKNGDIITTGILRGEENEKELSEQEKRKLRDIVIRENNLHIEEPMKGKRFLKLYEKYGFGMSKKNFGKEILDVEGSRVNDILRNESDKTFILTGEVVTEEYIEELRKKFFNSGEHCTEDMINYQEFLRLYKLYGGKLSEKVFSEKILFINSNNLRHIREKEEGRDKKVEIFYELKFSDAYIASLKAKLIKENLLYFQQPVTLPFLNKLYRSASTIMSERDFAKRILEVNKGSYTNLKNKKSNICFILSTSGTEENKEKFLKWQEETIKKMLNDGYQYDEIEANTNTTTVVFKEKINKLYEKEVNENESNRRKEYINFESLEGSNISENEAENVKKDTNFENLKGSNISENEIGNIKKQIKKEKKLKNIQKKSIRIMNEYYDDPKSIEIIEEYVNLCKEVFENKPKEMPEETLNCLQDCLEFLDANIENSLFFIKICIENMEYKRANQLVTFNMQSDNFGVEDKRKLQEMRAMIRDASKRKDTVMTRRIIIPIKTNEKSIFKS